MILFVGKNRMCNVNERLIMHLVQNDLYLVVRVFNFDLNLSLILASGLSALCKWPNGL